MCGDGSAELVVLQASAHKGACVIYDPVEHRRSEADLQTPQGSELSELSRDGSSEPAVTQISAHQRTKFLQSGSKKEREGHLTSTPMKRAPQSAWRSSQTMRGQPCSPRKPFHFYKSRSSARRSHPPRWCSNQGGYCWSIPSKRQSVQTGLWRWFVRR